MTTLPQAKYRQDYRTPDYTITDIALDFELDPQNTRVTAVSVVHRLANESRPLLLDGEGLVLISLLVNGQPWPHYQQQQKTLIIHQLPETFTLTIVNLIHPDQNSALEGLYRSGDVLCTQCEAEGFRRITYYLDRPDVLARFRTRIAADKTRYPILLSNGNRIDQGELDDGRHFVVWEDPFPKPAYLFALVAGDFDLLQDHFVTRSGRRVALELYVDRGNLDRADWAMSALKNAMRWDEKRFALEYDLDIYMIVAVDFFNMGAMENKGLNLFNAKYVLAGSDTATDQDYLNIEAVIGHEYFHNWTGNRVTCRDWFQLSLKEGLTVFREQEFSSDMGSRSVNRIQAVKLLRSAQFAEDVSPMSHPIRPDKVIEMNNFYTMTVYEKGAEVIRMIHTLLGEEKFQAGMRLYFERHDGSAVTCDDFVQAMESASGVDLTLFGRWYSQSGTPILTIYDEYHKDSQRYLLHVRQHTPPTADQREKLPLHIPLKVELYDQGGEVIPLYANRQVQSPILNLIQEQQTFVFEQIPEQPIISLLGDFSAPVKLEYPYSDQQLTFLLQHAGNDFARWDAAQLLLNKHIRLNVARHQQQQPLSLPTHVVDALRAVLLAPDLDPAFVAQLMTLPTENEIAELFDQIDPEAITAVREFMLRCLAEAITDEWQVVYNTTKGGNYQITQAEMARRALNNRCLHYLAYSDAKADQQVSQHYYAADNMTDRLAALTAAVEAKLPCKDELLTHFEQRWQHENLVMDKWFALQASSPDCDKVSKIRQLMNHPAFNITNPNRIRSLIGCFCLNNPAAFHIADGSGYRFLSEILEYLNLRNPQIASRLIEPLIRFQRYDENRQRLMCAELEKLKALPDLCEDLYEKISKSLVLKK